MRARRRAIASAAWPARPRGPAPPSRGKTLDRLLSCPRHAARRPMGGAYRHALPPLGPGPSAHRPRDRRPRAPAHGRDRPGLARARRARRRTRHAVPLPHARRHPRARSRVALPAAGRARPERGDRPDAISLARRGWSGRPWHETVLYELHVGSFTPGGTFRAAIDRLDHLVDLGVNAIEVMPVGDFPGVGTGATTGCCPTLRTRPTAAPRT